MTTLTSLRALVRRDLKDEDGANYRWTDDQIDRAIDRAVLEYSEYCPLQVKTTIATVDGSQDIDISTLTDRIEVVNVEHPVDQSPKVFVPCTIWQDTLTFRAGYQGDGENCYIYWLKKHSVGAASTIPTPHEGIIALGAAAFAISSQAQYQVDMANTGGQKVNSEYTKWAKEKFGLFYDALKRVKKYNPSRLKVSQLTPED